MVLYCRSVVTVVTAIFRTNPIVERYEDCLDTPEGTTYTGTISLTESFYYCERWMPKQVSSEQGCISVYNI